jgi:chromosome transmission fidelity protein 4
VYVKQERSAHDTECFDFQAPAIFDSAGVLHVLHHFRAPLRATWARMLDTTKLDRRQGKDESYWPVGVSGDMFMCLILKVRSSASFLVCH